MHTFEKIIIIVYNDISAILTNILKIKLH